MRVQSGFVAGMMLREAPSELGFGDNRLRCNAGRFIAAARTDPDARTAPSAIARGWLYCYAGQLGTPEYDCNLW
jgi:hypothetical protein